MEEADAEHEDRRRGPSSSSFSWVAHASFGFEETEDSETILARKGLRTSGVRVADNISNLGTSFGSYFSWISSSLRESSSKILRREDPSRDLTISDGPEGVEGADAPSAEDDDTVAAVPAFGVIEDETDDRAPPMLVDNKPAECGAEEP